ncbi:MAG TPA: hypothetical protein VHK91_11470 [Flavisolibacter sp.]|nr:hypothetical protein [Flavisolibacter sp.]
MRKVATILLLGILFFNFIGYQWVYNYFLNRADHRLEARLDRNEYDETSLTRISVPLNVPYQNAWDQEFQRYDGAIELNGIHYKYVKRKVTADSLILLCLPNADRSTVQVEKANYFQHTGVAFPSKNQNSKNADGPVKNLAIEYQAEANHWTIAPADQIPTQFTFLQSASLKERERTLPIQPPEC